MTARRTGLLSIREPYATRIFRGEKTFEYRRRAPRLDVDTRFLVYVPGPRQQLVGEIVVDRVISAPPDALWRQTGNHGGIDRASFMHYFAERCTAHALRIREAHRYAEPATLTDLRTTLPGGFYPPQYLAWLDPAAVTLMRRAAGDREAS